MRKESKLMSLGKVLNSLRSSHEIVEVHDGDTIFHFTLVHASNLEIWLIHEDSPNMPNLVDFRSQPGLDKNSPTRIEMAAHCLQRLVQSWNSFDVANRTEQANNHIELAPKVKVDHVSMMKDDLWIALTSNSEHLLV